MNLGQLKTHVANRTGNDAVDAVLTEFVNQVCYDFASRYPFSWRLSLPVDLTCIPNQNYLNPSAYLPNFGDPYDAYQMQTPQKMLYMPVWNISLIDPNWYKGSDQVKGVPTHYNVDWYNQRLWLYPTPDSAYALKLRYLKGPSEVSNTSATLFIPAKYHYGLAAGVESLVWQMDEDLNSAKIANERFEACIQKAIEEEQRTPDYQTIMETPGRLVDYSDPFLEI